MRGVGSVKKIAHSRSAVLFFITLLQARAVIRRTAALASPPRSAAAEKESRRDKLEVCVTPRVQRTVIYGRAQPNSGERAKKC